MVKKIEIKSLKVAGNMSEETIAFTASLWVDGKKVGEAKNQGHGGANDVYLFNKDGNLSPGHHHALLKELEEFASQHTWSYEGKTFNKDGNLSPGHHHALLKELEEFASQHTWSYEGKTYTHSLDSYIGDLVEELDQKQQLKRQLRGKTAYRIPDKSYKDGEYTVVNLKYTKEVGAYLRERHGDDVFIFNETV